MIKAVVRTQIIHPDHKPWFRTVYKSTNNCYRMAIVRFLVENQEARMGEWRSLRPCLDNKLILFYNMQLSNYRLVISGVSELWDKILPSPNIDTVCFSFLQKGTQQPTHREEMFQSICKCPTLLMTHDPARCPTLFFTYQPILIKMRSDDRSNRCEDNIIVRPFECETIICISLIL